MSQASTLGYDPRVNAPQYGGPQTREQWIANMATSLTLRYLNGAEMTEPEMANTWWQAHGLAIPSGSFGSAARNPNNAQDPAVYQSMVQVANIMFQERHINLPSMTPLYSGGTAANPGLPNDTGNLFTAGQNAAQIAADAVRQAGINQTSTANNAANNTALLQRTNADNEQRQRESTLKAQTDREAIAAENTRAAAAETGLNRRFDLQLAQDREQFNQKLHEDARQFNVTSLTGLLNTAVQLAKAPVDWLAYQYYMGNMSIPLTYLNTSSVATMLGAVPPSGPSAAGTVVGGPAAIDGNVALAQAVGAQAGFVPLSQAVQQNPGSGGDGGALQHLTAAQTFPQLAQQAGGIQQLDAAVQQAITQQVIPAVGQNAVTSKVSPVGLGLDLWKTGQPAIPPVPAATTAPPTVPGTPPVPHPPAFGGAQGDPMAAGAVPPVAPAGNGSTGPGNSGVYVGQPASAPASTVTSAFGTPVPATGTGAQNPQGEALLQAIATELGMPIEQIRNLVPVNLLAGGYSKEAIINSPVMKAIRDQSPLSYFRTADQGGEKFGQLQAFGVPLGARGGQDLNAHTFLTANPSSQDMIQGTFNASGQDWRDVTGAMLRASPTSNYESGSFGRRRF